MVMGALYGVRKQGLATEKLKLNCRPTEGGIRCQSNKKAAWPYIHTQYISIGTW